MEHEHVGDRADVTAHTQTTCEQYAQERILAMGADRLEPRPWRPAPAPPTAVDLTQYALWRSSELNADEILGALNLIPAARAEIENIEIGLLFVARSEGLTWAQIAEVMGFRSPQACQQYVNRLTARQDRRA